MPKLLQGTKISC